MVPEKHRLFSLCITISLLMCVCFSTHAKVPLVQELKTSKGANIWFIEDHYLPIVSVKITFSRSGFAYDPKGKDGLAYMVSGLLDEGAEELPSLAYKKLLEELASSISFSFDEDHFYISVSTLTKNFSDTLEVLAKVLKEPAFDSQTIDRIKKQLIVLIDKKEDMPNYIASTQFRKIMLGKHPYANKRYGTKETIVKLTSEDMVNYVKTNFTKQNISFSVAGKVDTSQLTNSIDKLYELLPTKYSSPKPIASPVIQKVGQTFYIDKSIPQSVVIFGLPGLVRNDDDFYASYLVNYILGGGSFESRLMEKVREKNGLAYAVYTYLETMESFGLMSGYVATKSENVERCIDLIKQEILNLKNHGIRQQELIDAQDYLVHSFPLKMTKNSNLTSFLTIMQNDKLGADFMTKRNHYVKSVSIGEADKIAYEMLNPEQLVFVVVGDSKK